MIASEKDVKELRDLQKQLNLNNNKMFVMPEGDTNERIKETGLICAEACKRYGWMLSWRLQTPLWGTARGT